MCQHSVGLGATRHVFAHSSSWTSIVWISGYLTIVWYTCEKEPALHDLAVRNHYISPLWYPCVQCQKSWWCIIVLYSCNNETSPAWVLWYPCVQCQKSWWCIIVLYSCNNETSPAWVLRYPCAQFKKSWWCTIVLYSCDNETSPAWVLRFATVISPLCDTSPFNTISIVTSNYVAALCGSWGYTPCLRTLIFINQHFMDLGLLDHGLVHLWKWSGAAWNGSCGTQPLYYIIISCPNESHISRPLSIPVLPARVHVRLAGFSKAFAKCWRLISCSWRLQGRFSYNYFSMTRRQEVKNWSSLLIPPG